MNSADITTGAAASQPPEEKKDVAAPAAAAKAHFATKSSLPAVVIKALLEVQRSALVASKNGVNTFFNNSRYATLDEILNVIREPLTANGFVLMQDADCDGGVVTVITRLLHETGAVVESAPLRYTLQPEFAKGAPGGPPVQLPPGVQQIGKAITYLRRYSLSPFLGISCENDDDGNTASAAGTTVGRAPAGSEKAPQAAAAGGPRKSVYTGELLDTPEAVERHKAAADKARADAEAAKGKTAGAQPAAGTGSAAGAQPAAGAAQAPAAQPNGASSKVAPGIAPDAQVSGAFNAGLYEAIKAAGITDDELDAYLRGEAGNPRIKSPVLGAGMTIHNMGERIVNALLKPENWATTVARVKAGRK